MLISGCALTTQAQLVHIIPAPVEVKTSPGNFILSEKTTLLLNDSGEKLTADFFNDYLLKYYGFKLPIGKQASTNFIRLNTLRFIKAPDNPAHYTLKATPESIAIDGDSYQGTFYGMQSLIQLLPVNPARSLALPAVTINDYPRFAYRGMHLDVGRHFFDVDYIKKYIDYIALHKMNTFHWHLTEDQGWRIEIKKYPKLTTVGGFRNGTIIGRYPGKGNDSIRYGGFYTQEQIKEVVKYAADRYITVIPEIEMPGHSSAAIAAYPELSCFPDESTVVAPGTAWAGSRKGKQVQQAWGVFNDVYCAGQENTFSFIQDVLDEVMTLFPSTYIHIGGDESPKANWKRCPNCQRRIKENKLKDEHELQSYFIQRIEKYLNSKGKQIIGWDEILEGGLAPNAIVMSWRGENGGIEAAKQKHQVIMTPETPMYFNFAQSILEDSVTIGRYTPVEKIYNYNPIPSQLDASQAKYIWGAQANLWTEYIKNTRILEYQLFPRMSALSEVLWSPKVEKNFNEFEPRLLTQFERYNLWGTNYSKALYQIKSTVTSAGGDGVLWALESKSKGNIFITNNATNTGLKYVAPILINGSGELEASVVENNKVLTTLKHNFNINKATGKKISLTTPPYSTYAGNGGAFGLVNGLTSQIGFNSPEWLGWYGKNVEAFIDLGKTQSISTVSINVWKQEPSGIYLPKSVDVFTSINGKDWTASYQAVPSEGAWPNERKITVSLKAKPQARYVRIVVTNPGIIPQGKQLEGKPSFLFIDEIEVD